MSQKSTARLPVACLASLLFSFASARAQTSETARVVDGCGGWSSNATFTTVQAACQPCPVGVSAGTACVSRAGFLESFLLFPALDHDRDGVADENDFDDDNDGLTDLTEIAGHAFNPATPSDPLLADTDGDGAGDLLESRAGTNPRDAGSLLAITAVREQDGDFRVRWRSREGRDYSLLRSPTVEHTLTTTAVVATVTAGSGTGVWHETVSEVSDAPAEGTLFYRVRLATP